MIGTVLKHRYEIQEKIGEGNLFTVYLCEDKIENRSVAAKVLLPQYASNSMFGERILVEAQAMVGVTHPGIVEVYDCGEDDGNYYVIVEYVRGVDLKERIRRNAPFTLSTAVDIGMAICDVLDFAHRRGFMHGDLRPGNVLVTPEGKIKISDFWAGDAIASSQSIRTSAMMRSVHYMSPEVAEGDTATPSGDVYSVGVILFELLSGKPPFDGDTPIAIALKHSREPIPSLRAANPGITKELEAVVVRALQKNPQERHRSARAMFTALKSVRDGLHLAKPIAWSQHTEKTVAAVPSEIEEDEILQAEPVILSAIRKTLLMIVFLIVIASAIMVAYMMQRPPDVTVPDLVGQTLEEARATAGDNRLQVIVRMEQFNEESEAGTIYLTNPRAGRMIKAGKSVELWISKGSQYTSVPSVVNSPLNEAKSKIHNAGLNIGEVSQDYSDSIAAGNVISQSPSGGTRLEREQPIKLVFSLGSKPQELEFNTERGGQDLSDEMRSFDVKFVVPPGHESQKVEIVVEDRFGENTALSVDAQPGDSIEHTVEGVGRVTIRIYIDDNLIREYSR